ncbi:hypothetical protein PQG02_07610 [Nostoc sp. UHCC 0926]|uniref:hypothetical protein n=1 Tax=unclassified Nostoc TaxID=2593658 RepID=UPI002360EFE5|nr:hypothetical protein [Nostoc sp. UHCC 0926]WDD34197.1 hypothetical protein PQG02_07610 [Nostoc sp. UHCC 0926]
MAIRYCTPVALPFGEPEPLFLRFFRNVALAQEYVAILSRALYLYQAEVTHPSTQKFI